MKSNKIKNMLVVASVVVGTTLVGSTSAFAATLPSNGSVSTNSSSKQSLEKIAIKNETSLTAKKDLKSTSNTDLTSTSKDKTTTEVKKDISKTTTKEQNSKVKTTTLAYSGSEYGEVGNLEGCTSLNFRQGPGTNYNIIGELSNGTTVQILSQYNSDWYQVEYNGTSGYVYAPCINIVSGSSSNSTSNSSEMGTVVNLNGSMDLNFRSGPSTNYSVIGELSEGTTFTVLSESNGWYKINYNGTTGYVYGYYVSVGNSSSSSTGTSSSSKTGTVSNLNEGVDLNFRLGPSTDYSVLGELSEGTSVTILSESNGWYKINYDGTVGYVYSDYITVGSSSNSSSSSSSITYTVQAGNTLSSIASQYGVTISQLEQWNNLSNPNYIYVGETLTIYTNGSSNSSNNSGSSNTNSGSSVTYTVQSGDTLSSIASQYGVTVSQLEQWNNLSNPNYIYVGETLTIYTNGSGNSSNSTSSNPSNSNSNNSGSSYTGSYSSAAPSDLVNFTASYEGFSSTPYWSGGWTVGFGQNYGNTYPGDVTYQEALNTLQNSLSTYMQQVESLTQGCGLNQNQINALTDFAYNLGIGSLENSQLLQDIESGNTSYSTIMSDFQSWSYVGGSFSSGLYARRTAEAQMFLYGQYNDH